MPLMLRDKLCPSLLPDIRFPSLLLDIFDFSDIEPLLKLLCTLE
jgi:hypothetical protein